MIKNRLDARLSVTLIALLLLLVTGFFITSNYLQTIKRLERDVLVRLHSISRTLSLTIDGDKHEYITKEYLGVDEISVCDSDSSFYEVYKQLNDTKVINELETDIYTLFIDSASNLKKGIVRIGVISGERQYFRHSYSSPPKQLLENFNKGGKIERYKDDHGDWLSAFSPILNSKNEVIGVVEVDEKFNKFLTQARSEAWDYVLISLLFILFVSIVLFFILRQLVSIDKEKSYKLEKTFDIIKGQNKKIFDSLNYAQNIQDSIIPKSKDLNDVFSEAFIYYKAKDVVSGDVPWFCKSEDRIFFAAIDCTGHGVPGALLSVIAYFLLKEITSRNPELPPGEILELLHNGVVKTLKQHEEASNSHDGMDISLCTFDMKRMTVSYAGANRPLYVLNHKGFIEIKGTRRGIGGTHYDHLNRAFKSTEIKLASGDELYICSDGFVDQMGGENGKKYGSRRLKQYLIDKPASKSMLSLKKDLNETLDNWKGSNDQIDDILVMGVKV